MKKLESIKKFEAAKLSKESLSKFHGGVVLSTLTEKVLSDKAVEYRSDQIVRKAERAATR